MLETLVAEHLDHIHYLNDILWLDLPEIADVLREQLLARLLLPLYLASLRHGEKPDNLPLVSRLTALFLLTQVPSSLSHSLYATSHALLT